MRFKCEDGLLNLIVIKVKLFMDSVNKSILIFLHLLKIEFIMDMGVLATDKNKVTLIYNSDNSIGKQTYAYVSSSEKGILAIDSSKTNITGTQWAEIADGLGIKISDLINQDHPDFKKEYGEKVDLDDEHDYLKILQNKPELLASPIVIVDGNFHAIETPSDFVKYLDADSAGVSRNPAEEE